MGEASELCWRRKEEGEEEKDDTRELRDTEAAMNERVITPQWQRGRSC